MTAAVELGVLAWAAGAAIGHRQAVGLPAVTANPQLDVGRTDVWMGAPRLRDDDFVAVHVAQVLIADEIDRRRMGLPLLGCQLRHRYRRPMDET